MQGNKSQSKKKMKRLVLILIVFLAISQSVMTSGAARTNRRDNATTEQTVVGNDGVEIYGNNGVITIKSDHKATVRVFTILGQLVSTTTIQPGTTRIKVASRGIYIVKIGNITQKIAL